MRVPEQTCGKRLVLVRAEDLPTLLPWISRYPEVKVGVDQVIASEEFSAEDLVLLPVMDPQAWQALVECVAPLGWEPGPEPIADFDVNGTLVYAFHPTSTPVSTGEGLQRQK